MVRVHFVMGLMQHYWLLSIPVLAVLAVMVYWIVRFTKARSRATGGATGGVR